ncbi:MAG: DUF2079 domain-containing protein [Clostridia bacterium]|nr:DUF2079 domain-containing protein [Clostridia bacterium]
MAAVFRRFITAWLSAVLVEYIILPREIRDLSGLDGLAGMSLLRVVLLTCILMLVLWGISRFVNITTAERTGIFAAFLALSAVAVHASFTWAFLTVCLLTCGVMLVYNLFGWDSSPETVEKPRSERKIFLWLTVLLSIGFFLFLSICTVCRIYSFSTPTYDFGIFAQMFHHMKESGLPMTTVERDGLLSHLYVHMSPIWYILLPFYVIAPFPATLQVLQAAILVSSVIPLWKIAKIRGLSDLQRMLICGVLLVYPALSGGASYDIHENCFLVPLILWLFWALEKKSIPFVAVFGFLTLTVKEDAAVYVAVIALYFIVKTLLHYDRSRFRELLTGLGLFAAALIYFFLATSFLAEVGDGVMTYRYKNFMYDGSSSLITVIKSVIMNPMKALYECVDAEKLQFIGLTMAPLFGLPLITRRYERYILLIPYLLLNLMSDYVYQHNIFYQYTFGPLAFLIYLMLINVTDLKLDVKRVIALGMAFVLGVGCFIPTAYKKLIKYPGYCIKYSERYENIRDTLSLIPDDASVTATTFYVPFLSQRDVLYDIYYASREHLLESEYVALNVTAKNEFRKYADEGKENGFDNIVSLLTDNGYELYAELEKVLVIYKKK